VNAPRRPAAVGEPRRALVIRTPNENPSETPTGSGCIEDLGHRIGVSTITDVLRAEGQPGRHRPMNVACFVEGDEVASKPRAALEMSAQIQSAHSSSPAMAAVSLLVLRTARSAASA